MKLFFPISFAPVVATLALAVGCGGSTTPTGAGGSGTTSTSTADSSASTAGAGGGTTSATGTGGLGQGGELPDVVMGTVNGATITVADAVFIAGTPGGGVKELVIDMQDQAGSCARIQANTYKQNTTEVGFTIALEGAASPVGPGTYAVGDSNNNKTHVNGGVQEPDPMCLGKHLGTKSGSVTITYVSSTSVSGTFDLTLENMDHITGSFGATACDMDIAKITAQACVP